MTTRFGGYRVVIKRASDFSIAFETYTARHCADVEELLLGIKVLVLPFEDADVGWAPVVVADCHDGARFTWHHPDCIQLFTSSNVGGRVTIGHTLPRGAKSPSHNIATQRCGVYRTNSQYLVLDARWDEANRWTRDTK